MLTSCQGTADNVEQKGCWIDQLEMLGAQLTDCSQLTSHDHVLGPYAGMQIMQDM